MSKFRLGTFMLPTRDVILIRTLVQLLPQENSAGWAFVNEEPYDALIIDSAENTSSHSEALPAAKAILRLTTRDTAPSPYTLQRPMRAEKLQEWLKTTAASLFNLTPIVVAPLVNLPTQAQVRFKLLRWPPSAVLHNDASLIRMASLLARHALPLAELAELSQQSVDSCKLFIEKLSSLQLLSYESVPSPVAPNDAALAPGQRALAPAQAVAVASAKIPFHLGLIGGIRKRLGL